MSSVSSATAMQRDVLDVLHDVDKQVSKNGTELMLKLREVELEIKQLDTQAHKNALQEGGVAFKATLSSSDESLDRATDYAKTLLGKGISGKSIYTGPSCSVSSEGSFNVQAGSFIAEADVGSIIQAEHFVNSTINNLARGILSLPSGMVKNIIDELRKF